MTRPIRFVLLALLCLAPAMLCAQTPPAKAPSPDLQAAAHRNQAFDLRNAKDYVGAIAQFQQAYALNKTAHHKDAAADLNNVGFCYYRLSQYDKAVEFFQQALPLFQQVGDTEDEAGALSNIGDSYKAMGQYPKALDFYQRALPIQRQVGDKAHEALTLKNIGLCYDSQGRYDKALDSYQQALPLLREAGDKADEAATLNNIGGDYFRLNQTAKALEFFQQALPLQRQFGDKAGEAATLNNIGTSYKALSQPDKALGFYQQALPLLREAGDKAGEATTLNSIGAAYESLSQYGKALGFYQQALPLLRQVGDKSGEATMLNNIGAAYESLSQYDKALGFYQQALLLQRQVGDKSDEASTLSNIGAAYDGLSQYDKALGFYQQALPLLRQVGDKADEATTLNNIGLAYVNLSQYDKTLGFYQQALLLQRQVGDKAGEAATLNNIGAAYESLSQYDKALEFFQQVLPLRHQVGDKSGEATTLSNIGICYDSQSQYDKALGFYQQALLLQRQVGDKSDEATTLNNIGAAYESLSQYDKALGFYQQALLLQHQVGDKFGEANTLSNIGAAYESLSQHDKALDFYQQALIVRREVTDRAGEAITLNNLMHLWKDQHKPALAIFYGKEAVNALQTIRRDIRTLDKQTQKTYLATHQDTFRDLAYLLISQGRLPEAQQVLGMLKEEEFFDFLGRDPAAAKTLTATAALTPFEADWSGRFEKVTDRAALLGEMTRAFQTTVPVQASVVRRKTLPAGTAAVYTIVAADKLFLILTTPTGQVAREYPLAAPDLYRKVLALRNALQDPTRDPRPLAQELYKIIVGPIEADLKTAHATTLLWSLDDALRYLPVAALYDGNHYLVERYDNALLTLAAPTRAASATGVPWTGLGLGVSLQHPGFDALPGVRAELSGIFGPVVPGTALLDTQFTQRAFLAGLKHGDHPLVHIASHFSLSGRDTDSFLLLGDGGHLTLADLKADPNVFGGVDLLTLSACNTAMEVRSASGKEVEGFGALAQRLGARSVLASLWPVADASTPTLMREFYRLRHANPKLGKAAGLRQAQLELLRGKVTASTPPSKANRAKRAKVAGAANTDLPLFATDPKAPYAHPYYWAPFVLIGNPQ